MQIRLKNQIKKISNQCRKIKQGLKNLLFIISNDFIIRYLPFHSSMTLMNSSFELNV